ECAGRGAAPCGAAPRVGGGLDPAAGTARPAAGAPLGDVADPRRGPALRGRWLERVRRTLGAAARAALGHVADPRRGPALRGRWLERVRRTSGAPARAALRHIT